MDNLMRRLKEDGSTGLDLSPGDPTSMEAYNKINDLQEIIEECARLLDNKHRDGTWAGFNLEYTQDLQKRLEEACG